MAGSLAIVCPSHVARTVFVLVFLMINLIVVPILILLVLPIVVLAGVFLILVADTILVVLAVAVVLVPRPSSKSSSLSCAHRCGLPSATRSDFQVAVVTPQGQRHNPWAYHAGVLPCRSRVATWQGSKLGASVVG